jgi:hypothetical protein
MSISVFSFFVYTPIPWVTILCIILYRHDLLQLLHPFKERCSVRDWKSVLQNLEIPLKFSSSLGTPTEINGTVFLVRRLRATFSERYPNIVFYALVIVIVAGSSLLSSLIVSPLLFGGASFLNSRFSGLVSAGLQIVSAIPSIFAMQRYFGPLPSAPNKFHLRKRRLGSLVRYEQTLRGTFSSVK